jgi:hypothetical protein
LCRQQLQFLKVAIHGTAVEVAVVDHQQPVQGMVVSRNLEATEALALLMLTTQPMA